MDWRPIATAPKDGCLYLLCTDGGIMFVGKYRKHAEMWVCQDGAERYRAVTHWMPLPQPPPSGSEEYELDADDLSRRVENVDAGTLRRALVTFIGQASTDVVRHLAVRLRAQTLVE